MKQYLAEHGNTDTQVCTMVKHAVWYPCRLLNIPGSAEQCQAARLTDGVKEHQDEVHMVSHPLQDTNIPHTQGLPPVN